MSSQAFNYGTAAALSKNTFTAPKGKTFAGWATKKDGKVVYTNAQKVKNLSTKNKDVITLYAIWVKSGTHKITYNLNKGTLAQGAKTSYNSGTQYTLPTPIRKGYTFAGWYTDKNLKNGKITKISTTSTKDITVYAKWTANT